MTYDDVRRALALPLPGPRAQFRMAPQPRPGDTFPLPPDFRPKEAGVLILLFPTDDDLAFFLTRRTETVENHKGQISLPGGAQEPGESLQETAARETCEELCLEPATVDIIGGPLTPVFVSVSGFRVTPYVAFTPSRPKVVAEPGEVVEIIDAPLEWLVDEKNVVEEEWVFGDWKRHVPFFQWHEHKVWGATAMMLSEFAEMLRRVRVGAEYGIP